MKDVLLLNLAVLSKDLRIRMRGRRAPIIITVYLIVLVIAGGISVYENFQSISSRTLFEMGSGIFKMLALVQMALIALIVPGLTGAAIAGERDRQTLDMLLSSQVSSLGIILGKLLSSVSYVLLLIVASLPIFSLAFLFGGISPRQVGVIFIIYIATAITLGSVGVLLSTWLRRGQMATIAAYGMAIILTIGTFILASIIDDGGLYYHDSWEPAHIPLVFNPFVGLSNVLPPPVFFSGDSSWTGLTLWQANLIADVVIVVICTWLSVRALRPGRRSLLPWRRSSHKMVVEAET